MAITAIVGKIGSGKSFKQLEYALQQCQEKQKRLVTNFGLNYKELRRYAALKKWGYVAHLVDTGQIACIDTANQIQDLMKYKNSVVCLDEAGIFLNSREFSKTPKSLLMDLAQSRKDGIDLIYASQFDEQVDKQMRMLTQWFIHAQGMSVYSRQLKRPKLVIKQYFYFDAECYFDWVGDMKSRSSFFRSHFKAFKTEMGLVSSTDLQLFKCFDSFSRLEKQQQNTRKMNESFIPENLSSVVRNSYKSALQRDTKKIMGIPFRPDYAVNSCFCRLPYVYRPGCLEVAGVPPSASLSGWAAAERLPSPEDYLIDVSSAVERDVNPYDFEVFVNSSVNLLQLK